MENIGWEEFKALRGSERAPYLVRQGTIFHVLMSQQFDRDFLDNICVLATKIRGIAKGQTGRDFLRFLLESRRAFQVKDSAEKRDVAREMDLRCALDEIIFGNDTEYDALCIYNR